ncbi:MAG: tetratricopeptide repeat family protein [Clostridia bacterium]|jgi:hypothetical protein|nr:tetratricopeptide repeat family protein [Clostridia bacterium]
MDVEACICVMSKVMNLDFEQRKPVFEKYKSILKEKILHNSNNVDAVCLLAMILCELRYDIDASLYYLQLCTKTLWSNRKGSNEIQSTV